DEPGFIDIEHLPLRSGVALLLCSDGLSDTLSKAQMFAIITASGDRVSIVDHLIQAALEQAKDNITAVFVQADASTKKSKPRKQRPVLEETVSPTSDATEPSTVLVRRSKSRSALRWLLPTVASLLLGGMLTLAAEYVLGVAPFRISVLHNGSAGSPSAVLHVSMNSGQNPISAALTRAQSGDVIEVSEGQYSENIQLKDGVTLLGANATLHSSGIAVSADNVRNARITGFHISADAATNGLTTGVSVHGGRVQVEQIEVSGAQTAGIEFSGDATGNIQGCLIHHNAGPGILIRDTAAPDIQSNIIFSNGYTPSALQPGLRLQVTSPGQISKNVFFGNAAGAIGSVRPSSDWLTRNEFGPNGTKGKPADVRLVK
ncbi:MAG: right-handed parallel beta-helix repeat-containing protein, partial [Acidobacteriaceae bacterium]|nr:right-handed parallel beta-helix repeat-containing protein [Acidobacteriaceae bacterium]